MTSEILTILIAQTDDGRFEATADDMTGPARGDTIAAALRAACQQMGRRPQDGLQVKVGDGTLVPTRELVTLLETGIEALHLDLSRCNLNNIDLGPVTLNSLDIWYLRSQTTSGRGIRLRGVQLQGALLLDAQLQGADLQGANLQRCNLDGAQIQGADLSDARLDRASLHATNLDGCILDGANLDTASLWRAQLRNASLVRTNLQNAGLRRAELQNADLGGADLRGAKLWNANFERADLRSSDCREVDFRAAASLEGVRWHDAKLEKTKLRRDQIEPVGDELEAHKTHSAGDYDAAMEAYLDLKTNFNSLGDYEATSWAYVKEQQMEKMANHWRWRPVRWRSKHVMPRDWGALRRWISSWIFESLTGYGERWMLPLLWGAVTIVVFAVAFYVGGDIASGDVAAQPPPPTTRDVAVALTHSIATFATVGFNTLEPVGAVARLLTAVEAMFGIGLFALVIYTLGNRMSRS